MLHLVGLTIAGVVGVVGIILVKNCYSRIKCDRNKRDSVRNIEIEEPLVHAALQIWQNKFLCNYLNQYFSQIDDFQKVFYRARTVIDVIRTNLRSNKLRIDTTDSQYKNILVRSDYSSDEEDDNPTGDLLSDICVHIKDNELFFRFSTESGVKERTLIDLITNDDEFQSFLNEWNPEEILCE